MRIFTRILGLIYRVGELIVLTHRCFCWTSFLAHIIFVILLGMKYLAQILGSVVALTSYLVFLIVLLLVKFVTILLNVWTLTVCHVLLHHWGRVTSISWIEARFLMWSSIVSIVFIFNWWF